MTDPRLPHHASLTFGLAFVPPSALGPVAEGGAGPAETLVTACRELDATFAFVPAREQWAHAALELLLEADVGVFWAVDGPLWPVLARRGLAEGLRDTLLEPDSIAAELGEALSDAEAVALDGLDRGARGIVVAEDLAGSTGPLVAPDFAIETLLPRLATLVQVANDKGVPAVLHSDGEIRPLLGAVRRAGFSAVHAGGGLSFDAFDRLFWAARSEELAVLGGLQTTELTSLTKAEVLGSRVGLLARAGGLLVADDGGITTTGEVVALAHALAAARSAAG
jgi:hypothetical protein